MKSNQLKIIILILFLFNFLNIIFGLNSTTSYGFNLTYQANFSQTKFDSINEISKQISIPFVQSSTVSQITYDSKNLSIKYLIKNSSNDILCFNSICSFNYDDDFIKNNQYLMYNLCNNQNGCAIGGKIPFTIKDGGLGFQNGFQLKTEKYSDTTKEKITIYSYGKTFKLLFPTSSNTQTNQIIYNSEDSDLLLKIQDKDLNQLCFGSSCSFNYNDDFLKNNSILVYSVCNNFGSCSSSQNFPLTLKNGGIGIQYGFLFHGVRDFNGTVIPSLPSNENSNSNSPKSIDFPSTSNQMITILFFLILGYLWL